MDDAEANTAPEQPPRRWVVPSWLLAVLFAVAAGTAAFCWSRIASFDRSTIVLTNAHGMRVVAAVFTPRRQITGAPSQLLMPAIVAIPPAATPPDATLAVTLELVRRGALVVVPDFKHSPRGLKRGPEGDRLVNARVSDVEAILDYLESRKDVHPRLIGLLGHSFGGVVAIRTGIRRPGVSGTVSAGGWGPATFAGPRNLSWIVGLYDEYYPLEDIERKAQRALPAPLRIQTTEGDFVAGTARKLEVIPTADHFTELWNPRTAQTAIEWFDDSFIRVLLGPNNEPSIVEGLLTFNYRWLPAPWFYACYSLAFLFGWLLLFRAFTGGGRDARGPGAGETPTLQRKRQYFFSAAIVLLIVFLCLVPLPRLSLLRADLCLWALALVIAANARPRPGFTHWVLLAWASAALALFLLQAPAFWRHPGLLAGAWSFPFWFATGLLNEYLFVHGRTLAFASFVGAAIHPRWFFWVLLGAEAAYPGVVFRTLWNSIQRVRASSGARRTWQVPGLRTSRCAARPKPRCRRWAGWALILGLFLVPSATVLVGERAGTLDREGLELAACVLLKHGVFPFAIFAFLTRITKRRVF